MDEDSMQQQLVACLLCRVLFIPVIISRIFDESRSKITIKYVVEKIFGGRKKIAVLEVSECLLELLMLFLLVLT